MAKSLFPEPGPPGVVFLRLLFGAVALWAIARPRLRGRSAADLRLVAVLGVVLVSMNPSFYGALDRAPPASPSPSSSSARSRSPCSGRDH